MECEGNEKEIMNKLKGKTSWFFQAKMRDNINKRFSNVRKRED